MNLRNQSNPGAAIDEWRRPQLQEDEATFTDRRNYAAHVALMAQFATNLLPHVKPESLGILQGVIAGFDRVHTAAQDSDEALNAVLATIHGGAL